MFQQLTKIKLQNLRLLNHICIEPLASRLRCLLCYEYLDSNQIQAFNMCIQAFKTQLSYLLCKRYQQERKLANRLTTNQQVCLCVCSKVKLKAVGVRLSKQQQKGVQRQLARDNKQQQGKRGEGLPKKQQKWDNSKERQGCPTSSKESTRLCAKGCPNNSKGQ